MPLTPMIARVICSLGGVVFGPLSGRWRAMRRVVIAAVAFALVVPALLLAPNAGVLAALILGPLLPRTDNPWLDWAAYFLALGLFTLVVGLIESMTARFRMNKVPQFLMASVLATAFAFLLLLV